MAETSEVVMCRACSRSDPKGIRCTECRKGLPGLDFDGHALGQPCDICGGRGFDYIGRTCRLLYR